MFFYLFYVKNKYKNSLYFINNKELLFVYFEFRYLLLRFSEIY